MRKSTFALAMLLLVVIAWLGLQGNSPRAADAKPAVPRWEYQKISWSVTSEGETLNQLGDKGWEMCGVVPVRSPYDLDFQATEVIGREERK